MSILCEEVGDRVERAAREFLPLVEPDPDGLDVDADRLDAVFVDDHGASASAGDLVEVKGAVARNSCHDRGRFLVKQGAHEMLCDVEADPDDDRAAWYVLVVYSPSPTDVDDADELVIERIGLVRARTVDALLDEHTWTETGRGRQAQTQLCWSRVFDSLDHPGDHDLATLGVEVATDDADDADATDSTPEFDVPVVVNDGGVSS